MDYLTIIVNYNIQKKVLLVVKEQSEISFIYKLPNNGQVQFYSEVLKILKSKNDAEQ